MQGSTWVIFFYNQFTNNHVYTECLRHAFNGTNNNEDDWNQNYVSTNKYLGKGNHEKLNGRSLLI